MRHPLDAFAGDFKRWSADDWKARAVRAEAQHASTLELVSGYRKRAEAAKARVVELERALGAIVQAYEATKRDDCMDLPRPVLNLLIQVASASALLASPDTTTKHVCRLECGDEPKPIDHERWAGRAPDTTTAEEVKA